MSGKKGRPTLRFECTLAGCAGHSVHTMTTYTKSDGVVVRRCLCSEGHRFTSYDGAPAPRREPLPALPIRTEWRPYPFAEVTT